MKVDPHYSLLPGKLYAKISDEYPYHEQLPQASVPDEVSPYTVKHRFRHKENGWPLIQIGPGILTVNHTEKYTTFDDFRPLAVRAVENLFDVYPKSETLTITSLLLRYIDAKIFDYKKEDIHVFLKEKMGIPINLPQKLFADTGVEKMAKSLMWNTSFACNSPKGLATLKFATGLSNGKPALIWEQIIQSGRSDVPEMPKEFGSWIDNAYRITKSWFHSLIKGDLEREFGNG